MKKNISTPEKSNITRTERFRIAEQNAADRIGRLHDHNSNEDAIAMQISKKLGNMELTMADLIGVDRGGPILSRAQLFDGMEMPPPGRRVLTEEFPTSHEKNFLSEQNNKSVKRENTPRPRWSIKRFMAEMKNGTEIPVWKVANNTGFALDKIFKIKEVADKLVFYLNESGNMNDPRVINLISVYNRRDQLLKEIRILEKEAVGKPMKTKIVESKKTEVQQLDYRLGI